MICTNCGAQMMDTDQFCPKCGTRVIKDKRCPDCGAVLRDGTKFCHKCGRPVAGTDSTRKVSDETLDIPIDTIEQNILSETAAEIKADHRDESVPQRTPSTGGTVTHASAAKSSPSKSTSAYGSETKKASSKSASTHSTAKKNTAVKKRVDHRADDWEDDDWDDEEEGPDIITIMTIIVGCVLLVVVAVLGYHLYQQYAPKNYEDTAEEPEDEETGFQEQEMEDGWEVEVSEPDTTYTLTVTHNVNVRDNPSTSDSNILKVAQEGETYTCYGSVEGGEWYEILLEDGSIGYVFHEYVTVDD